MNNEHTSVAQLASTSSLVSSTLANSLSDYELDKEHEHELQEGKLPQISCTWPNCPPPEARPCQVTGTCLSGKADQFAGFPSITTQRFTQEEGLRKDEQGKAGLGCRNFLSSLFASWEKPRPQRWPDNRFSKA